MTQMRKVVSDRIENVMEKGENAGYHNVFEGYFLRVVKSWDCAVKA